MIYSVIQSKQGIVNIIKEKWIPQRWVDSSMNPLFSLFPSKFFMFVIG